MSPSKKSSLWPIAVLVAGLVGSVGCGASSDMGGGGSDGTGGSEEGDGGKTGGGQGGKTGKGGAPGAGGDKGSGGAMADGGSNGGGGTAAGGSGDGGSGAGGAAAGGMGDGGTGAGGTGAGGMGDGGTGAGGTMVNGGSVGTAAEPCTDMPMATPPALKKTLIANVMGQPGQAVGVPGEPDRLYIVSHKTGSVFVLETGKATPTATLAKVNVATGGNEEQGLLSIALHPDFKTNQLFYVLYTATNSNITVDEFKRMSPTTSMKTKNIWDKPRAGGGEFHNGGTLFFNPKDSKAILYHSVGNNLSNQAGQPMGVAGRVLAHDVASGMSTTFAYGLRNPYRMSIDRLTGDMWIGEVSNASGGSVYFNPAGKSGTNFGYTVNNGPEIGGGISGHDGSSGAIIGGVVYRGKGIPGLCGRYMFGMWRSGAIKSLIQSGGQRQGAVFQHPPDLTVAALSSFGEDWANEIIMSSMNGQVYRLEKGN